MKYPHTLKNYFINLGNQKILTINKQEFKAIITKPHK